MIGFARADRLIARHVLGATALSLAIFVGIDALGAFVREIDEIGDGDYTLLVRPRHRVRGLGAAVRFAWRVGVAPATPVVGGGTVGVLTAGNAASVAFSSATPGAANRLSPT